jgi:hypothetical protein
MRIRGIFISIKMPVTSQQILTHRQGRKAAGLMGCITGKPIPPIDFFGFKDVQIWRTDSKGCLPGDPDFNPRDPGCFCFDCRNTFDKEGVLDAELVNEGHPRACEIYASLIKPNIPTSLPPRINVSLPPNPSLKDLEKVMKYAMGTLEGCIHSELILTMDRRQRAILCDNNEEANNYLEQEHQLQDLQAAVSKLRDALDGYCKEVDKFLG